MIGSRLVTLEAISEICAGITLGRKLPQSTPTSSVPYLRVANVKAGKLALSDVKKVEATQREIERLELQPGDILLTEGGDPDKLGRGTLWQSELPSCIHQNHVFRARVDSTQALASFVNHQLQAAPARAYFFSHAKQTTGIATINQSVVRNCPIWLPPLDEQREISFELDRLLALSTEAQATASSRLEIAGCLESSLLRKAFHLTTPILIGPPSSDPPNGWSWRRLSDLAKLESGHTPSRKHPEWWGGDIPWIALPDIRALDGKVAMETKECTNPDGIANSSARILPKDTVVLSRTASVGFVSIMGRPMATSQDFVNWICGDALSPRFLMHALRASRSYLLANASGAIHKTIYMPAVKDFYLCLPDRKEQDRIAKRLDEQLADAEAIFSATQAELEAIEALPAALLRRIFSPAA